MAVKKVVVIVNGVETELSYDSASGNYFKQLTAPSKSSWNNNSEHYYPVTAKAEDTAGNIAIANDTDTTLGNSLKLDVDEKTAPVSTITTPTAGQKLINAKPTVTWKATDNDSGVDPDTIAITIDSGSKVTAGITKTAITGGYQCSYTVPSALSDGSHTVKVDATDFDGNKATQRTVTFTIDTVPPQLSVTSPTNNLATNNKTVTVAGTTNDVTSSPCTVTVKLNSGAAAAVTVGNNGAFSTTLTLIEGSNTIVVTSTDAAGKSSSVTRTVLLDTKAPVIKEVTYSKNPVSTGEVFTIYVKVED